MFGVRLTDNGALESLGLGGDGDEVEAISDVEREFGVVLDHGHAGEWRVVGDVYAALLAALPTDRRNSADLWARFAGALCAVSGTNPALVRPKTLLLSPERRSWLIPLAVAVVIGVVLALRR